MTKKLTVAAVIFFIAHFCAAQQKPDIESRVDSIVSKMTVDEKIELLGGINDFYTRPIPRPGIPSLRMSDGPMGVHDYGLTTAYPAGIALAASWDIDLAHRFGVTMGKDARARGVHFILGPGMNIYRAPMNGRNFEYFGEDPYLASRMAVSEIKGIQEQGAVAVAKHFAGNNSEFARMTLSSDIDERTLREIYLPAFEASVKEAHVGAVMDAYNLVNGVYMTANSHLNIDILKKDWGFNGILMSDWGATHDGVAAANGGLDLEMPSPSFMNRDALLPALKDGRVSMATIDDKVRRILRTAIAFGFFDRSQTDSSIPLYSQEGREVALEEARGGMVLLKNEGNLLPINENKLRTIAVIGPDAYPAVISGGGSAETKPFHSVSFLEGISDHVGTKVNVLYDVDLPVLDEVFANSQFTTEPGGGENGLKAEYFSNQELKGPPALTRVDPHVHFDWGEGSFEQGQPVDHFSVRWTSYYTPKDSGDYEFFTSADDGARLYLDDERIIDDWQSHSQTLDTATRHLEAGKAYKVRLEYFEDVGSAIVGMGVVRADAFVGVKTKALAAKADAVIICVGFDSKTESEGADRPFQLPGGQDELIRQISAVNKNTIVVITAGGNVDMTQWVDKVPAVLDTWYPGQEGGTALAQILFGDYSPSGKLPASFERRWEDNPVYHSYYPPKGESRVQYSEGVFVGYRGYDRSETRPLFPFGFGLSYTTFVYSNLSVTPKTGNGDQVTVSFDVKDTGHREGAEVAELYVGDPHASVPRPVKELKGFAKVDLKPGESKRVTLKLDHRSFSYYDVANKDWNAEPGPFMILIGSSSDKIQLKDTFTLTH